MTFRTRNLYYLRISEKTVLPIYVYLDKRHVEWMSDATLQHVMADLRPNILPKLKAETNSQLSNGGASSKKRTVDTHRGDTYQFCYFVRNTEPHSVVIKMRDFKAKIPRQLDVPFSPVPSLKSKTAKRPSGKDNSGIAHTRKKRKTASKARGQLLDNEFVISDSEAADTSSTFSQGHRRSANKKTVSEHTDNNGDDAAEGILLPEEEPSLDANIIAYGEASEGVESQPEHRSISPTLEVDEEKPKPILGLRYQGFSIYGYCMCLVVEPWPPIRSAAKAPSLIPTANHSLPPPPTLAHAQVQAKGPLFLPDDSEDALPAFDRDDDEGMMIFSQVLHNVGESRAGAVIDDEETEGIMFYGDADERREL